MNLKSQAAENLLAFRKNTYPGRGIIIGLDENGNLIQVYILEGRSEQSRNRVLVVNDDYSVETVAADPAKVKDPSLIIYTAMAQRTTKGSEGVPRLFVVSNGHQTMDALSADVFKNQMLNWEYEPDAPNFTPRITALSKRSYINLGTPFSTSMSILKKSPISKECYRNFYKLDMKLGLGHCITTYSCDGDPLPSFEGEPYLLPLIGDIDNIANTIWDSLNEENRVSLAVRFVGVHKNETIIKIINKYKAIN